VRVVLDEVLRTPVGARVLGEEAPTVVVTTPAAPAARRKRLARRGVNIWELPPGPGGGVSLRAFLRRAAREGWLDLFFEGGRKVATSLVREDLLDRLIVVQAPLLLGGAWTWLGDLDLHHLADGKELGRPELRRAGNDVLLSWMSGTGEKTVLGWNPD
jgi:diaminohydroxyphosphoribosylaminopyrimidine deaminase/5-amino-6-(5-phosphoribosylamino)uracil reductase